MSESSSGEPVLPSLLLVLTAVTGLVDAVSFLALGHVFTANMTGNVVFLAFAAAGVPGLSVPRSTTALLGFLVGAVMGGKMAMRLSAGPQHRWTSAAFGSEAALLIAATAASTGYNALRSDGPIRLYAVIVITAVAMGIRNATVRKLGVPDLTTTVLTLTMAGLASDSSLADGSNPRWLRRVASVVTMFAGAAIGALLLRHSLALPLAVSGVVSCVCAVTVFFRN